MAIVFKSNKYDIKIDSKMIIGVMGNYDSFFKALKNDNIYYIDKMINSSSQNVSKLFEINDNTLALLKEYNFNEVDLNKKVKELSHSSQKILKYILMILSNKKIIVIDEPFLDLDYDNKKKITLLLKKLIKEDKTVIVGSNDSNIIYSLCKKVLFINDNDCYYADTIVFKKQQILTKYHVDMPDLVSFTEYAKEKNIKLGYSNDIRDLIKDVYRNVSQK